MANKSVTKKPVARRNRKNIDQGEAHIHSSFNNTIVTTAKNKAYGENTKIKFSTWIKILFKPSIRFPIKVCLSLSIQTAIPIIIASTSSCKLLPVKNGSKMLVGIKLMINSGKVCEASF